MVYVIGLLAAVILVLTFVVLGRMSAFVKNTTKEAEQPKIGFANKVNAALFPIVFILGTIAATWSFIVSMPSFLPTAGSEHGVTTDKMFWWFLAIVTVSFYLTAILLFYFAWKYQYKPGRIARFYPDNHKLEVFWTTVPAILMATMVLMGWTVWKDITKEAPNDAVVIELMGKQFGWYARYPGADDKELGRHNYKLTDAANEMGIDFSDPNSFDDVQASTLMIPKGVPVLLKIRARDVLHSVFLPHLRVKMDAVPGMPTKFWFTATKTTDEMKSETNNPKFEYQLNCTEVCGPGHFGMKMPVQVVEEDEYYAWVKSQKSFLAAHNEYLDKVPASLKNKALKYMDAPAAADSSTAKAGGSAVGAAGLR